MVYIFLCVSLTVVDGPGRLPHGSGPAPREEAKGEDKRLEPQQDEQVGQVETEHLRGGGGATHQLEGLAEQVRVRAVVVVLQHNGRGNGQVRLHDESRTCRLLAPDTAAKAKEAARRRIRTWRELLDILEER